MWRISALDRDGREIGRFDLVAGEVTIGREADRQLVLASASVSRRHARIVVADGGPCIIDEGSSNGVLVNGVRIQAPTAVGPSTRIDIAEFRIALEAMQPQQQQPMSMPMIQPMPPTAAVAPLAAPVEEGVRLVAEGGPYDGRVFTVRPGTLGVGRAVDNDLVFEDPSLSRKHARVHREGDRIEVEDLGSSNGTWVNNRKITRAPASPGDVVRFGDLSFRVEGGAPGSTRSVEPALPLPRAQLYALAGGGALTFLLLLLAIIFLIRKVPPVAASARDGIAKVTKQASEHLERGRALYHERKYGEAKIELEAAIDLDPANAEVRRLRLFAVHGADDDRNYQSAMSMVSIVERKELDRALAAYGSITEGAPQRETLAGKLAPQLERLGTERCAAHAWADCAWALCKFYEVAPSDARPDARAARTLRDAEKKLAKDRTYQRCRAAN